MIRVPECGEPIFDLVTDIVGVERLETCDVVERLSDGLPVEPLPLQLDHDPAALSVNPEQVERASLETDLTTDDSHAFGQERWVSSDPVFEVLLEVDLGPSDPSRSVSANGPNAHVCRHERSSIASILDVGRPRASGERILRNLRISTASGRFTTILHQESEQGRGPFTWW